MKSGEAELHRIVWNCAELERSNCMHLSKSLVCDMDLQREVHQPFIVKLVSEELNAK
jgi:hypothetical protein